MPRGGFGRGFGGGFGRGFGMRRMGAPIIAPMGGMGWGMGGMGSPLINTLMAGGELLLFIDESQITYLENLMWEQGYLDATQMAAAFQMLRSNDRIWSRMIHEYLLGQREPLSDLMAWDDSARPCGPLALRLQDYASH